MTVQDLTLIAGTNAALPAEPFAARHLIDGVWRDSADGATFDRISPAHGVLVTRAAKGGAAETEAAIAAARAAFDDGRWSELARQGPRDAAAQVADLIDRDRERIARVETLGSGQADRPGAGRDRGCGRSLALRGGAGADAVRRQPQQPRARHARAWC